MNGNESPIHIGRTILISMMFTLAGSAFGAPAKQPVPLISEGKNHQLVYTADDHGNRVPDFSYAGYRGGDASIPDVPVRIVVSPVPGDDTARIQAAIDYVASLSPDQRGAVLLLPGRFDIAGEIKITASGVVLRGSGSGEEGTELVATGYDRRTLITVAGKNDRKVDATPIAIADSYLPVNSSRLRLSAAPSFKPGDTIVIRRPSTAEWIKSISMADLGGGLGIGWKAGTRDLFWDRTVTAVDGNTITIDAPLTTAIDANFGGGTVAAYTWPGRISEVGIENIRCESAYNESYTWDEAHSWMAVTMENVQDAWVRQVTARHFVGSAVSLWDSCKCITVEDCKSDDPISEVAGFRRHTFFTNGQQTLFQRCWSENGRHDFSVGFCATGPNAFVQCEAINALDDSGPIDSWASGILYDNVKIDRNALTLGNRRQKDQFAGWAAANSLLWNSSASLITCEAPPGAMNWVVGCWGQYNGNGYWENVNAFSRPQCLYYSQLANRTGKDMTARADWMTVPGDPSSSPNAEHAAELIAAATQPAPQLANWIESATQRHPIPTTSGDAKKVEEISSASSAKPQAASHTISIENGWIVCDGAVVIGSRGEVPWWRGGVHPQEVAEATPAITRFVPGRVGPGLTDDLNEVTDTMLANHQAAMIHHYALWYDRRDDDHENNRRMNADAWPPFYDLPFARSGVGYEYDGLSKYDLTQYNHWYWSRLKTFADLCDQKGLVLIHENFFQHNIIEDCAHWATCPWRTANNINNMGFPEPPNNAGEKRVFMAEQFYDETNPVRREIFRNYIRQCMNNFADNSNVIQLTSAEFTGPLHFTNFWLDCIAEWEKETGKHPIIGISACKDVQDAILADPVRSKLISVINIEYWWYQSDGTPYAPPGGQNLSPRQWERVIKHRGSSFEQVFRAVREYRDKYPDKAVIYSADSEGQTGLAQLIAGGSIPFMRISLDPKLLSAIAKMKPLDAKDSGRTLALSDGGANYLFVGAAPKSIDLGAYTEHRIEAGKGPGVSWFTKN